MNVGFAGECLLVYGLQFAVCGLQFVRLDLTAAFSCQRMLLILKTIYKLQTANRKPQTIFLNLPARFSFSE